MFVPAPADASPESRRIAGSEASEHEAHRRAEIASGERREKR
jgi:hypothetical protein